MSKKASGIGTRLFITKLIAAACCARAAIASAQDAPPIPIEHATGQTGAMQVLLSQRSPLSDPQTVAKRLSMTPSEVPADYDLTKSVFSVYIPHSGPGDGGRFGLMVGIPLESSGAPAPAWPPVLEKYHLIWIGANNSKDLPATEQFGLLLDAESNACRIWPIDGRRVYVSDNNPIGLVSSVAFYYPDVFDGMIGTFSPHWFADPSALRGHPLARSALLPRPIEPYWDQARSRWYFQANQQHDQNKPFLAAILNRGYHHDDFENVKFVDVPTPQIDHYNQFAADWFEQGVQFLDEGVVAAHGANPVPTGVAADSEAPSSRPAEAGGSSQPPLASVSPASQPAAPSPGGAADASVKAQRALDMAKNYVTAQRYEEAHTRLQAIIDSYPNTPAAAEAGQILKDIQDKYVP